MQRIPASYETTTRLHDGRALHVRTIRAQDREALLHEFHRLSPESVRNRFFGIKHDLTPEELEFFTVVDFSNHVALVAELELEGAWQPAGVARFVRHQDARERAEMAITVAEGLQGNGIGTVLLDRLIDCARLLDIRFLDASIFAGNLRMLRLMQRTGLKLERASRGSIYHLTLVLQPPGEQPGTGAGSAA